MTRRKLGCLAFAVPGIAIACSAANPVRPDGKVEPPPVVTPVTRVLAGAGDIAQCENDSGRPAAATARLIESILPDAIFTTGDNAYPSGTARNFAECYGPTWGRFKSKTFPSLGNHEYESAFAAPYFQYFGDRAGPSGLGFYSYEVGNWHIVSLNSMAPLSAGSE